MTRSLRIGLLSLSLLTVSTVALTTVAPAVDAAPTELEDATGMLRVTGEGTWRPQSTASGIRASGFIDNKRTELVGELEKGEKGVKEIADAWKELRAAAGKVEFREGPDVGRFIAYAPGRSETQYVRALAGAGHRAVVWVKVAGEPGQVDDAAFALLDTAELGKKAEEPKDDGGASVEAVPEVKTTTFQDVNRTLELTVPEEFKRRKTDHKGARRVLSLIGPVGSDPLATLDVHAFPDFDRVEALGWWWITSERAGWEGERVAVRGEPPEFRVELEGETWTRHVRVFETDAGLFGINLDVESNVTQAVHDFLDKLVSDGIEVKRPRAKDPLPPEGFKRVPAEGVVVFARGESGGVDREVKIADGLVQELTGLSPRTERLPVVRVYDDADSLAGAVNKYDLPAERQAYWVPDKREIFTHAGVSSTAAGRGELMRAVAVDALQRRFGFRPPYWIEAGISLQAESFAINKGQKTKAHPRLKERAQDAAGGSIEFEPVRFWTNRESAGNAEREAVAWSLVQFFTGTAGRKWSESYKSYLKKLAATMQPAVASKEFAVSEASEVIEVWKKFVRKL